MMDNYLDRRLRLTHSPTGTSVEVSWRFGKNSGTTRDWFDKAMSLLKSKLFALYGNIDPKDVIEELL